MKLIKKTATQHCVFRRNAGQEDLAMIAGTLERQGYTVQQSPGCIVGDHATQERITFISLPDNYPETP